MIKLRDHQEEGVSRLLSCRDAGYILAFEMGLGKTATVLRYLEIAKPSRTLILCPAVARREWLRQANLFFPQLASQIRLDSESKEIQKWGNEPGIYLTGYNPKLTAHIKGSFDVVVCDEAQEISNPDVTTSALVAGIIGRSEDTFFVGMSGTPSMNAVEQAWHICHLSQPGQWGAHLGWFKARYLKKVDNEFAPRGYFYKGLREDRREELERRFSRVMFRVRKEDVARDLPPLTVGLRYIKPKRTKLDWDDPQALDALLSLNSAGRIDATVDLIKEAHDSGQTHFVVFTYLRDTAAQLAGRFRALNLAVEVVDGGIPADVRHVPIVRVREGGGVLVATIDSIGVSLDLTFAQTAVFCESHWQPGATSQALGRLQRLSSTHPVSCYFVVCEGTVEERKAAAFVRKQNELDAVIASGSAEADAKKVLQSAATSGINLLSELF